MFLDTNNLSPAALCAAIDVPPAVTTAPFHTNPDHRPALEQILELSRLRTDAIKARLKLTLQALAVLRRLNGGDKDLAAAAWSDAVKNEDSPHRAFVDIYIETIEVFKRRQSDHEKLMVRAAKTLPIYAWAKSVNGFGDVSLAIIIGETTGLRNDTGEFYALGDFKSVSAVWKRMGLAVIGGERQRKKSGNEAILHGYSPTRRSAMWNIGNSVILGMGKFRPVFGEDIEANPEYTYFQKVFAQRARYEAGRLPHKTGEAIKESKTGKDSYTAHAANRAKRYVEKRLLRCLFAEWRICMG